MKDADSKLLFEAYQKVYEAPIGPGSAWDDDDPAAKFEPGELEKLAKYGVSEPEMINDISANMKRFIKDHEGGTFPGNFKEFKGDVIDHVRHASGLGKANGKYVARVISNVLSRLDQIDIDAATGEVTVNVADNKAIKKAVKTAVDSVAKIKISDEYEIGVTSGQTPDSEADKAHEILSQAVGRGFKATGREIINILRKEVSLDDANSLANELLHSDGIIVPEREEDDEEKEIDLGDDDLASDDTHFAGDYWEKELGGYGLGAGSMDDY